MKEYRVTYEVVIKYTKVLRFEDGIAIEDIVDNECADKVLIAGRLNADDFECAPVGWERLDRSE